MLSESMMKPRYSFVVAAVAAVSVFSFAIVKLLLGAQRLINLEIPVLVRSLKSSNVELG